MTNEAIEEVFEPEINGYKRLVIVHDPTQNEETWGEKFAIILDPDNQQAVINSGMLVPGSDKSGKVEMAVQDRKARVIIGRNIPDWLENETNILVEDFLADTIDTMFYSFPILDLMVILHETDYFDGEWVGSFAEKIAKEVGLPVTIEIDPEMFRYIIRFHRNNFRYGGFPKYIEPDQKM